MRDDVSESPEAIPGREASDEKVLFKGGGIRVTASQVQVRKEVFQVRDITSVDCEVSGYLGAFFMTILSCLGLAGVWGTAGGLGLKILLAALPALLLLLGLMFLLCGSGQVRITARGGIYLIYNGLGNVASSLEAAILDAMIASGGKDRG